ncbi:VOC family protein [Streptomyces sp. 71268]|uniref:VOC family protein n=1 Tax=Streptomyces sp. 71268 TaxID=3002640 RepID=UPI0023F9E8D7|nr:VOC family protein [Streptomyces sp. 71268]WEV28993.1 VOC family protein [Streptomyces sp. 71268]
MVSAQLTHLRHVDLAVPDLGRQLAFYTDVWGLTRTADDTGVAFLAAEGSPEQYVVRLRGAREKRLDLVAFGVAARVDVDVLAERLAGDGVVLVSEPGALSTPGGGYGFRFFDVDGRTVEVSAEVAPRRHRRIEAREPVPVRLSHVVFNAPDIARTRAWYERHLGLRLTDTVRSPRDGDLMHFLRINPQHHCVAFSGGPHTSLHHVSFELRGVDEYLRASGRAIRAGAHKLWGPGRHLTGDNAFTYFLDPHGNTLEYTTAMEQVDEDTWHPHVYDASRAEVTDQWGTSNPWDEQVAKESLNDPDGGCFVAPPL